MGCNSSAVVDPHTQNDAISKIPNKYHYKELSMSPQEYQFKQCKYLISGYLRKISSKKHFNITPDDFIDVNSVISRFAMYLEPIHRTGYIKYVKQEIFLEVIDFINIDHNKKNTETKINTETIIFLKCKIQRIDEPKSKPKKLPIDSNESTKAMLTLSFKSSLKDANNLVFHPCVITKDIQNEKKRIQFTPPDAKDFILCKFNATHQYPEQRMPFYVYIDEDYNKILFEWSIKINVEANHKFINGNGGGFDTIRDSENICIRIPLPLVDSNNTVISVTYGKYNYKDNYIEWGISKMNKSKPYKIEIKIINLAENVYKSFDKRYVSLKFALRHCGTTKVSIKNNYEIYDVWGKITSWVRKTSFSGNYSIHFD